MSTSIFQMVLYGLIFACSPSFAEKGSSAFTLKLKTAKGFETIPSSRIAGVRLLLKPPPKNAGKKTKEIYFHGEELRKFLERINFDSPMDNGSPAAMATGEVFISVKDNAWRSIEDQRFVIYNDRLLQDSRFPTIYYPIKKPITYSQFADSAQ